MKKLIFTITIAVAIIISISSCSNEKATETSVVPFGNADLIAILDEAGIDPVSDDFIIQSFEENVNIYKKGEKKSEKVTSLEATFFTLESYNVVGKSIENGYGYIFKHNSEAAEYYAYISTSENNISFKYLTPKTIWFELETDSQYKQDIITMLDNESFNSSTTYISVPYLTKEQRDFSVPEHTIEKCKG